MAVKSRDRRAAIKRQQRSLKPGAKLFLEDLARIWGVSKARFVNIKRDIPDFPDPIDNEGTAHVFDAAAALDAMWSWETRNDQVQNERASRHKQLLGKGPGRPRKQVQEEPMFSAAELLKYGQLQAMAEEGEERQRTLVKMKEVSAVAGVVFTRLSTSLGALANAVDPNGLLSAETRAQIDQLGKSELLRMHTALKGYLTQGDANGSKSKRT